MRFIGTPLRESAFFRGPVSCYISPRTGLWVEVAAPGRGTERPEDVKLKTARRGPGCGLVHRGLRVGRDEPGDVRQQLRFLVGFPEKLVDLE